MAIRRQRMVRFKRDVKRDQVIVTVSLGALRPLGDMLVTLALLAGAVAGLAYSSAALSPPTYSSVVPVTSEVREEPAPEVPQSLPPSRPLRLQVPAIALHTDLIRVGQNDDGTLEVPERYDVAGWYDGGPTPGEVGPAVIVGHVDNYRGAAVFYDLKELKRGDVVRVIRADGSRPAFTVEKVALFSQNDFPTKAVYGNIDYPGLRLITCGGVYNAFTGQYSHNTVVYARYDES